MVKNNINQEDNWSINQKIEIIDGPWNEFKGVISSIDRDKKKVVVMVDFWGKATPVELSYSQIKPLD